MRRDFGVKDKGWVVGVDGGGTETVAALADLKGRILRVGKAGSSNPRNIGIERASENIALAIKKTLKKKGKIVSTFIGLPAVQEDIGNKKEKIKKILSKHRGISPIFRGKLKIGSDQITAFRAGTRKKDGLLIIAGTGCVAHGWKGGREEKASGWGWLADEGAAFWTGQKSFQAILKDLDGRGAKTLITKIAFQDLKVKNRRDLLTKVYSKNHTEILPSFSVFCDKASKKGDKVAQGILLEAAKELLIAVKTVILRLDFKNQEFPLVLVGGMFESEIVLNFLKKEIRKFARKVKFVHFKGKPVIGAVRLAIEMINDRDIKSG